MLETSMVCSWKYKMGKAKLLDVTEFVYLWSSKKFFPHAAYGKIAMYGIIDQLEPVEQDASTFRPRRSLGYWAMLGALVIGSLVLLTGGLIPGLSRSRETVSG